MKRAKLLLLALTVLALAQALALPAFAQEGTHDECVHDGTIQSLQQCVQHAIDEGHVTSPGIADSLLSQVQAAQAALDRGQDEQAVSILNAFVRYVDAQAGVRIVAEHAEHLVHHAHLVIAALTA